MLLNLIIFQIIICLKQKCQINTLIYFILLLINLFKPDSYKEARKMLDNAKISAKNEWEANKK